MTFGYQIDYEGDGSDINRAVEIRISTKYIPLGKRGEEYACERCGSNRSEREVSDIWRPVLNVMLRTELTRCISVEACRRRGG